MKRILVGIGGSSGAIYGKILLDRLASLPDDSIAPTVLMSNNGKYNWQFELGNTDYKHYGFPIYNASDAGLLRRLDVAAYAGMIVCPCSMGLLGRMANANGTDVVSQLADRVLAWRKPLLVVFRDKPLNAIHSRNIDALTRAGGIVIPATPSFYTDAQTTEELAATIINRSLDLLHIDIGVTYRWGETADERL